MELFSRVINFVDRLMRWLYIAVLCVVVFGGVSEGQESCYIDANGNGVVDFADYVNFANQWGKQIHTPEWCKLRHALVRVDTLRDTTRVVVRDTLRDTIYVDREVVKRDTVYQTEIEYEIPPGIVKTEWGYGAKVGCGEREELVVDGETVVLATETSASVFDGVKVAIGDPSITVEECARRQSEASRSPCGDEWFVALIESVRKGTATAADITPLIVNGHISPEQLQELLAGDPTWEQIAQRIEALVCE